MIRVGLIGLGNMATAMVKGWTGCKVLNPDQIYASAAHFERLQEKAAALGIHACQSNREVVENSDIVIFAVKPYMIETAAAGCKELLAEKLIISIAAGMPFEAIEKILPHTHHISVIPNTPIEVGQGIVVTEQIHSLSQEQRVQFEKLFEPVALIEVVPAAQLSIAGTLAGCGPAFAAMFIEALADASVRYGLTRQAAYNLAAKMLEGTGALYLNSHMHPGALKDAVCSPGGTTIKGVCALEKNGFKGDVVEAIEAIEG